MIKSSPLSQQKIVVSADPDKTAEDFVKTQWEALDNKKKKEIHADIAVSSFVW